MSESLVLDAVEAARRSDPLSCVVTGDVLDSMTFPPLAWSVPGVVPEGFGLLVGAPKLGKSWLALGVGLALATGGTALGAVPVGRPRPCLYLALEDGERRLQGRCRTLLGDGVAIPDRLHVVTRLPEGVSVQRIVEAWLERHGSQNPLVLLDTLGKVMPPAVPGESAYQRDYRVGGQLKALTDGHPGTTLLVVHHNRKAASEDWMDGTSGTQGLNGAADFTVAVSRARGSTDALLKVTGRDVAEAEYAMNADAGTWRLTGGSLAAAEKAAATIAATAGLGDAMTRLVEWVNSQSAPITPRMAAEALGGELGLDNDTAGRYLRRAAEKGRVRQVSRGYYWRTLSLTPLSEASECPNPGGPFGQPDTTDTLTGGGQ